MDNLQNEQRYTNMGIEFLTRMNFFSHVIAGNFYPDRESLLEDSKNVGVDLIAARYVLISVKIEKWGDVLSTAGGKSDAGSIRHTFFILDNVTNDIYSRVGKSFGTEFLGRHMCIISLNNDVADPIGDLKSASLEAVEFLEDTFNLSITIAISQIYDDIMDLPAAMSDTTDIFEYISLYDEDVQAVAYDDFSQESLAQNESDYLEMESKLLSCIRASDFDGARRVVHDMAAKEFYLVKPSIKIFRHRVYGFANTLLHLTETLRQAIGDDLYYELDPGTQLCEAGSIAEILEFIDELFDRLLEFSEEKKKDVPPPWVTLVRNYVDTNYTDFNITVSSVSDKFNISPSYCSRIFKQYAGLGLFEYIQRRRLEAAKSLMNTNMSVKSIADEVGFSSSLTMNRAFKRYEGTTPSKFKDM